MSELGKMNAYELSAEHDKLGHGMFVDCGENVGACELRDEWVERSWAETHGAPGRHAMLSRAQVVACLGPLLNKRSDIGDGFVLGVHTNAIHACARALLNLPSDAKSPLEET